MHTNNDGQGPGAVTPTNDIGLGTASTQSDESSSNRLTRNFIAFCERHFTFEAGCYLLIGSTATQAILMIVGGAFK